MGLAMQRAEDKTAQMQARAGAMDELLASGALDDVTSSGPEDDIARELDQMSSGSEVEGELAAMKAQLGGGSAPKEIAGEESSSDAAADSQPKPEGEQA